VSDVIAAALWAVDTMFNVITIGVKRWAFHGMPHGAYSTIVFPDPTSTTTQVQPLYYGLLAFAQMTRNTSSLITIDTVVTTNPFIKAWAVIDADLITTRVVVIHKDPLPTSSSSNATITIQSSTAATNGSTTAVLTYLLPGNDGITTRWDGGLSYGGLTWSTSSDGEPTGTPISVPIDSQADGSYQFDLPPFSAAFIEIYNF
jgi:hypothetical protein